MKYLYYPGCCCTYKATGIAYEESLMELFDLLGLGYEELDDWSCCGATMCPSVDDKETDALVARNLTLAERQVQADGEPVQLVTPCSACYMLLYKAETQLRNEDPKARPLAATLDSAGLAYSGKTRVRHPLDVVVNDFGLDRIAPLVKRPLTGLKVASYYGCLLVRPFAPFDDAHRPTTMDRLMSTIGAEPVNWSYKTRCCGGYLASTIEEVGLKIAGEVLADAKASGSDVMATACPFCECNLECYQGKIRRVDPTIEALPVVYFSQLLGVALGIPEEKLGLNRLLVPLQPALKNIGGKAHALA